MMKGDLIKLSLVKYTDEYDEATSKFFGTPVIPGEWFDDDVFGENEIFVCQLCLEEIKKTGVGTDLPQKGYIYVFAELSDGVSVRLIYFPDEPDTAVDGFNDIAEGIVPQDALAIDFSPADTGEGCPFMLPSFDENGNILLLDLSCADVKVFGFLGKDFRVVIGREEAKELFPGE